MKNDLPRWVDFGLLPFINLTIAFAVSGLVVMFVGENPIDAAYLLLRGSLGYGEGIGYTLYYATNFIFTGLAVAVAFHCGLFNIGGEGQAYLGGLGVALACLAFDRILPWYLTFPIAILGGALFGGLWALIPAWLQAKRGSHIVITTIMFNFIASALMVFMMNAYLQDDPTKGSVSRTFESGAHIPKLDWLFGPLGVDMGVAPANISFLVALVAAVFVWVLIWRTRLGYEMRTMGTNPTAAKYAGIPTTKIIVIAMMISGALAGLMALNPVMGEQQRLFLDVPLGAGFVGIAVALMGRSHPVGIIPAAILFGMLYQGGAELAFDMPNISRDMIVVIQGLVILFTGALEHMFRPALVAFFSTLSSPISKSSEGAA